MPNVGERKTTYWWRQTNPQGAPQGREWLIGRWSDAWSADMDVQGEGLPIGLVANLAIEFRDGQAKRYLLRCYSPTQGWQDFNMAFENVRIEGNPAGVIPNGRISPQGAPKLLYHRDEPMMDLSVKIIHANYTGGVPFQTRTYTFVHCQQLEVQWNGQRWVEATPPALTPARSTHYAELLDDDFDNTACLDGMGVDWPEPWDGPRFSLQAPPDAD